MTIYPNDFDTDNELPVVDDNDTEYSGEAHNKLREAVISVERTLGINPQGTAGTVADRIDVSLDEAGNLRSSAIAAIGLLTNIVNSQVDAAAGIDESKLNLYYHTNDLKTLIDSISATVTSLGNFSVNYLLQDIAEHMAGNTPLPSGYDGRHKASHVDTDEPLLDKFGATRSLSTVMEALLAINDDLVTHETAASDQHVATAVSLDTSNFETIPKTDTNVQKAIEYIDSMGTAIYGEYGATLNSNGITKIGVTNDLVTSDGYSTFLFTEALPVETIISISDGINDVVKFFVSSSPTVTANQLDTLFASISVGDYITINYGGYVATFAINAILFTPQTTWDIKIDGINLAAKNTVNPGYAYIEQKKYDDNVFGNLAVCPANHDIWDNYASVPCSVIVVPPRSPQALGMELNLADLDSTHYNLYIDFYPNGNPADEIIRLPGIDVTGNKGVTPGKYTLEDIIRNTNNGFRAAGFNYRMVAFERQGQFGLAVADWYGNPGFSINSGVVLTGTLTIDQQNNVIGNDRNNPIFTDMKDALGLGNSKANVASPTYSSDQAAIPTKVIVGKLNKKFNVFGKISDVLASDSTTNADGYWSAEVASQSLNLYSMETTYTINQNLATSKIRAGSTIVVLPVVDVSDSSYVVYDYGRFIVKSVNATGCDPNVITEITVINGISTLGLARENSTLVGLPVKIYHCDDSVTFDQRNLADSGGPDTNTKRLYEIFVNKYGETLAYERVRLPITTEELAYVTVDRSYGWHVVNISPKFKGYVDTTQQNRRFVKLTISDYDSSDESFKARLSENSVGTSFYGPVAIGRKNEILRVYDDSGTDYIDLLFDDLDSGLVLSNPTEIVFEVFLTESLNEEFMCIGSCCQLYLSEEINGGPVSFVTDRRQFGTVNERILSDSAISFIESNNRLLHENSVINGFDYVGNYGTSSAPSLVFSGGSANVNGSIIHRNTFSFPVFPIALDGANNYSQKIVLCLDNKANLWWAPLTEDGTFGQITAPVDTSTSTNTTLRSYPLEYIVNNRKDLIPIYVLSLVSKINISTPIVENFTVQDIRKFTREAHPNSVTVCGEVLNSSTNNTSQLTGNFDSLKAAVEYAYLTRMSKPKITIKGIIELDEEVILSDMIVDGAPYNLMKLMSSNAKLSVLGNTTISGIKFQRCYSLSGSSYGDNPGYGTIITEATSVNVYQNITVENCNFTTQDGYQAKWAPHILLEQADGGGATFKNITIKNNTFEEQLQQTIIALVSRDGGATYGTVLNGVTIDSNKASFASIMLISSDSTETTVSIGLEAYGLRISNNMIGAINLNLSRISWVLNGTSSGIDGYEYGGYSNTILSRTFPTYGGSPVVMDPYSLYVMQPDVSILNNTLLAIQSLTISGDSVSAHLPNYPTPSMLVAGNNLNFATFIVNGTNQDPVFVGAGHLTISNNRFTASLAASTCLSVLGSVSSYPNNSVVTSIHNNMFISPSSEYADGGNYKYTNCIVTYVPAVIHHNVMSQCFTGYGIQLNYTTPSVTNTVTAMINNNTIIRGSTSISGYITLSYNNSISSIKIVENTFDSTTINGTNETPIKLFPTDTTAQINNAKKIRIIRNVNQTFNMDVLPYISDNITFTPIKAEESNTIGWFHTTLTTLDDTWGHETDRAIVGTVNPLPYVTDSGIYYLDVLVINIPYIDNAMPDKLYLSIRGYRISGDTTAYVRAFGPDGSQLSYCDHSHELSVSPATVNWNSGTGTEVVIDLASALIGNSTFEDYTDMSTLATSRQNAFPVFLYLCDNDGDYINTIALTKTDSTYQNYDDIWITEAYVKYRY